VSPGVRDYAFEEGAILNSAGASWATGGDASQQIRKRRMQQARLYCCGKPLEQRDTRG
jgi:hypothetical protein